jgi:tRNA (guanine37-N1)-methyltransferase
VRISVVTLFPEFFESPLRAALLHRAGEKGLVSFRFVNPRDFTQDKHRSVDDYPYGGGPGMILRPEPIVDAVESITRPGNPDGIPVVLLSPQGQRFRQEKAVAMSAWPEIVLLCGRYKGMDERVRELVVTEELSAGDYVLSGGEAAALMMIDAVVRLLPGALGDRDSAASDSFSQGWRGGLDCAYYTRPPEYRGLQVPEVLLSGHHARIAEWRHREAEARTRTRRPDLESPEYSKPGEDPAAGGT